MVIGGMASEVDTVRRTLTIVCMVVGWVGSMTIGIWSAVGYDVTKGHIAPTWMGLAFVFLIGVGVAASSARARQKLSTQMIEAFRIGLLNGHDVRRKTSEQPTEHDRSTVDR